MLRVIIEDYLASIKDERAFDLPFIALLAGLGYFDIHKTHGSNEKGKDFIAKFKTLEGVEQWVFQSKCGNITKGDWGGGLNSQMFACEFYGLEHPSFCADLPRQSVIVATGTVKQHALNEIDSFNKDTVVKAGRKPLIIWDRLKLVEYFVESVEATIYLGEYGGISRMGDFLSRLGDAIKGKACTDQIELYSRSWYRSDTEASKRLLNAASESAVLAWRLRESVSPYEALHSHLGFIRSVAVQLYEDQEGDNISWLRQVYGSAAAEVCVLAVDYNRMLEYLSVQQGGELSRIFSGTSAIVAYPVTCMRLLECFALRYFLSPDELERGDLCDAIVNLLTSESGCSSPISDRYAVSIVWSCLVLVIAGRSEVVDQHLRKVTKWICDRYVLGFGLAGVSADAYEEVCSLLGYPFESIQVSRTNGSFIATAICDLAAFMSDVELYEHVTTAFRTAGVYTEYYQCDDSLSQFEVDGLGVAYFPSVRFSMVEAGRLPVEYADHMRTEVVGGSSLSNVDASIYVCVSILLRDRYFPLLWTQLRKSCAG